MSRGGTWTNPIEGQTTYTIRIGHENFQRQGKVKISQSWKFLCFTPNSNEDLYENMYLIASPYHALSPSSE